MEFSGFAFVRETFGGRGARSVGAREGVREIAEVLDPKRGMRAHVGPDGGAVTLAQDLFERGPVSFARPREGGRKAGLLAEVQIGGREVRIASVRSSVVVVLVAGDAAGSA